MNILYCVDETDNNYSRHVGVSLISLFESNKKQTINIYIISSTLKPENKAELQRITDSYGQKIHFFIGSVEKIISKSIQNTLIWNKEGGRPFTIFYRMFFSSVFPEITDRILYLDSDTLITKDLEKLYTQDFEGNTLIGGRDVSWMRYWKKQNLGIENYINSGVLLINIPQFIATDREKELTSVNEKYGKVLTHYDQDYLNLIFKDHIKIVNYQINCLIYRPFFLPYNWRKASILHTVNKPFAKPRIVPKDIAKFYTSCLEKTKRKHIKNGPRDNIAFLYSRISYLCVYF
ncbi:hypothetical protein FACS189428_0560 [Clostridia bacterium]|nr:hypothetical protein FACS189428_0560 [Clostridia bacterium]